MHAWEFLQILQNEYLLDLSSPIDKSMKDLGFIPDKVEYIRKLRNSIFFGLLKVFIAKI